MKTNIMGTAVATVQQMQSYIQKVNPAVPKSVIDMVEYYISEGKTEGVRGDIAFAQSCLETGNFTFNGSAVTLDQNNFAGIGVTKNGMKGNSFSHPWIGIRAQIQHLKAYASNEKLYGVCVDPRFCYVKRGIAPYVEWLGIQENPQGGGWAAGKNYGSKILEILAKIIAMPEANKEDVTMNLNTSLISNNNSYANQVPKYIVIHNTDNFAKGANAKAHAKAQHDGNFSGYSAHVYVDDTEAYQATPFDRGAWHVGVNYGGGLFGICNNHNSIGIEMCVQAGYNYEKAFQNTVEICKMLMKKFGIDANHVVSHYDVCAKNCPSAIRAKGDWKAKLNICFNFSCMKRAIEKSKFNSTFLEEAMEIQCMISCGVIMLMIDTTTISIVCWAIPDLFDRIGCDVLIFFHGIEQVFTNWQTPTIFSASDCQGIINNFLPTIHEVY